MIKKLEKCIKLRKLYPPETSFNHYPIPDNVAKDHILHCGVIGNSGSHSLGSAFPTIPHKATTLAGSLFVYPAAATGCGSGTQCTAGGSVGCWSFYLPTYADGGSQKHVSGCWESTGFYNPCGTLRAFGIQHHLSYI